MKLPAIITLSAQTPRTTVYDNHPIAHVNDHVVRISTMYEPYHWHCHPNSDETFLVLEGVLVIELEHGPLELAAGQMVTISRGIRHRTRPVGNRSVSLTFEAANTETEPTSDGAS